MLSIITYTVLLFTLLILLAYVLGNYMAKVFSGEKNWFSPIVSPLEKLVYRLGGIDPAEEMNWKKYTLSLLMFNAAGVVLLFILQLFQAYLPLNPQQLGSVRWDTALNTAISFVTNTNWQPYAGESTMSYLTQMAGLTVQNFLSAATGFATALALFRGFTRKNADSIGNFWVDMTRSVLYVLLPLSLVFSLVLVSQGVIQTFSPAVHVSGLEGRDHTIPLGPVASQEAIKHLGNNGGGFFNANSSHPFENPNTLTNFLEIFALLLIPFSFPFLMGFLMKSRRKGIALFTAMFILLGAGLTAVTFFEYQQNPNFNGLIQAQSQNMEGKETRFGLFTSVLFSVATTATSSGAVNSMHESMLPLTGLVQIFNIGIGEIIFGGAGTGIISMLFYAFMTLFLAGLMIGRTPEIYNKKLEPYEMIMTIIGLLAAPIGALTFSSLSSALPVGLTSLNNSGPRGLSEFLYNFASPFGNNGSSFAGMNANTVYFNLTTGAAMLIGRFATIIPALAIAGSLAKKRLIVDTPATFQTSTPLFVVMLVFIIVVFGGLTFFMPFVLGPALEQLMLNSGKLF